jgi:cell division initiation protein
MSDLSPLDILGKSFKRRFKGYDPDEVHEFLTQVASTMEGLLRSRGELNQQVHRLERDLTEFRKRENALQDALVSAQCAAKSTKESAQTEAQKIIEESQVLADRLAEEAYARAQNIESKIGELRSYRREVRAELLRLVELVQGLVRDDQRAEREERPTPQLALLRRRRNAVGERGA